MRMWDIILYISFPHIFIVRIKCFKIVTEVGWMQRFNVTGMTCAACSARVEKAVNKIDGVSNVSVNLLTNSMIVEGDVETGTIINAVVQAGYGASLMKTKETSRISQEYEHILQDRETPVMKNRLIASIIVLIPLMYVSMGHVMWGWKLPEIIEGNYIAIGLFQLLLTTLIMIINQKFFINGTKGVINKSPNMDTLVALGAGASYLYSVYALFVMSAEVTKGNNEGAMHCLHEFYFESAAMILTLITLGKMLEAYSKGKTTDAIKGLMRLAPKTANVIREGEELQISVDDVVVDDIFVVRPGEAISVDGVVVEGGSSVDESTLTGESIPVDKEIGAQVFSGTMNQSGFIKCRATHVGKDTTLSQIIQMVSDAAATKAPIAKIADKVSGIFVPIVIAIAIITIMIWLLVGQSIGYALARGISVLVISCPCALGLATPVAIMVGNGVGARLGILFKTAVSLEETGKVSVVALDKTGTITMGKPQVTDVICAEETTEKELLGVAYAVEQMSEHPLAKAVVDFCKDGCEIEGYEITDFKAVVGNGLTAIIDGEEVTAGNNSFVSQYCQVPVSVAAKVDVLAQEGKTPLYFSRAGKMLGVIAVADVIKSDSIEAIKELKALGVQVVMLTGDNEITAKAIGRQVEVDQVIAGVLPEGKKIAIEKSKNAGDKVLMVGDGINDAPALTSADIGIAIGAGTDIAIDAADVVLMKNSIKDVALAIRLSRKVLKNIHENLFWAFIYNIIGIPLAAGVFIPIVGWTLNPMFGAAAMSLSSFCVVTNALRLNLFKGYKESTHSTNVSVACNERDCSNTKNQNIEKGDNNMKKTMKIEGMMCGHCEARVKKVLEALPQVEEAIVSHENDEAVVKMNAEISDEELKKAVEEQDYTVVSIS